MGKPCRNLATVRVRIAEPGADVKSGWHAVDVNVDEIGGKRPFRVTIRERCNFVRDNGEIFIWRESVSARAETIESAIWRALERASNADMLPEIVYPAVETAKEMAITAKTGFEGEAA